MRLKYILIIMLFLAVKSYSQENQRILFTIDDEPFYTQEFLNLYTKNLSIVTDSSKNDAENYLNLFVDYKLKVKEAKQLKIDTLQKFKLELEDYKEKLVLPYLKDKNSTKKLVDEAYERLQKEVNVSHILIFVKEDASPKDTLEAYNKLLEAKKIILNGEDFESVAIKYSEDPSAKQNGGEIGYFTVLQMVYPFENAAFSTGVNQVSDPFRTKFGFHILKVNGIREARGEVEVAHIMVKNETVNAVEKIDSIYKILETGKASFEVLAKKVSDDRASASKGGELNKFGSGNMVEDFANVAFSLKEEGEISKPFETKFGWHIAKLIKKYPVESFEKVQAKLTEKVEKDSRSVIIEKTVIDRLFKQYTIHVNNEALNQFEIDSWKSNPEKFQSDLVSIESENIGQDKFINYLKFVKNMPVKKAFTKFKEQEVLSYYKKNIEHSNKEFADTFKEFKEGMLLFELLEQEVWEKATDSIGLLNYFESRKIEKYKQKNLEDIKGLVISDYQTYLEKEWVKKLHSKYEVTFKKMERKKVLKSLK